MEASVGYVYALINRSMPGLVKVGRTARAPATRVAELSGATGVPTPFELVYDILVPDAASAERLLHDALSARGYRTSQTREFFEVPIHEVVKLMVQTREAADPIAVAGAEPVAVISAVDDDEDAAFFEDRDALFRQAAELCVQFQQGSTSLLQRRLRVGYGRAARLIDELHRAGVLGPPDGSKPREVLIGMESVARICEGSAGPESNREPEPKSELLPSDQTSKKRGWFG